MITIDLNPLVPQATYSLERLQDFINPEQLTSMVDHCEGEDGLFYVHKMMELANIIDTMPKTYDQDGLGDQAVAYLHYFIQGQHFYITEQDVEPEQLQAYGLANDEKGYISIVELLANNAELDLAFVPKMLAEIHEEKGPT